MPCPARYKVSLFLLFAIAYGIFYILPNFHPSFQPAFLPLLDVDRATPFLPWTFFIYISDYLLMISVIAMHRDVEEFKALARVCFSTLVICGLFFFFFPTEYPRPPYPTVSNPVLALLMSLVNRLDAPTNCFPSMHVAITGIGTWSLRRKGMTILLPFCLWSIAIFVSTMTTKQHYFLDVVGGLMVVAAVAGLEWFLFERAPSRLIPSRVAVWNDKRPLDP